MATTNDPTIIAPPTPYSIAIWDIGSPSSELINVNSIEEQSDRGAATPSSSRDGQLVAFASSSTNLDARNTNGVNDIFLRDRTTGRTSRMSIAFNGDDPDAESVGPVLSPNGRYLAFRSSASNLVEDDTNGVADAFLVDR